MPPRLGLSTRSLQHRAPQFFNASRTTSPPPGSLTSSLPAHPSEISRPITKNELLYAPHMAVPGWAGVGGKTPLRVEGLLKDTPPTNDDEAAPPRPPSPPHPAVLLLTPLITTCRIIYPSRRLWDSPSTSV